MIDLTTDLPLDRFARFRNLSRITDADGYQFQHVECDCGSRSLHPLAPWLDGRRMPCVDCSSYHAHANSDAARRLREQEVSQ